MMCLHHRVPRRRISLSWQSSDGRWSRCLRDKATEAEKTCNEPRRLPAHRPLLSAAYRRSHRRWRSDEPARLISRWSIARWLGAADRLRSFDPFRRRCCALWAMLRFDDRVQAALFNPQPPRRRPIRRATITEPFRFNAVLSRIGRSGRVLQKIGGLRLQDSLRTSPVDGRPLRGPAASKRRSPGTSVSKDGARSGSGAACRCTSFCGASARISGRVMSPSPASTAIRPVSTWRARCIRKPSSRLISNSSRSPRNGEPRCGCEYR